MQRNTIRHTAEQRLLASLPAVFEKLSRAALRYDLPGVVVLCHDADSVEPYQFRTADGRRWSPPPGAKLIPYALMKQYRTTYEYSSKRRDPGNIFIAFDLDNGHIWFTRQFKSLANVSVQDRLDATTLTQARIRPVETPPAVNFRATEVRPEHLATIREKVGSLSDMPEEVFLIGEDLLRLAADSLAVADPLAPVPVHLNAIWVFSRPVRLMRSTGLERHIRAVWFRQGAAVWRNRAYIGNLRSGRRPPIYMNGEQLSGRNPFVPQWDAGHPEQKFLAAIWALMQQGDVTETEPLSAARGVRDDWPPAADHGMHIVQLKAGSEHKRMYQGQSQGVIAREAWSVRGHWRRQPYPSLGLDENGKIITKMIWIASYTKGAGAPSPDPKIISVR